MPEKTPPPRAAKRRRRCVCATAEACFACGRCLEQHCVCGASHLNAHAIGRLSRACNCRVLPPTSTRCARCRGCRQSIGGVESHCRCERHDGHTTKKAAIDDDKRGPWIDRTQARARRREITRATRRGGLPSSQGLYAKKIVAPCVGVDEFGEACVDLSDEDEDEEELLEPKPSGGEELQDAIHPVYLERSRPAEDGHVSQVPLSWSHTQPLPQAMEAPPTHHTRAARGRPGQDERLNQSVTSETIDRSLENAVFERDREDATPSEALVDYLLLTASVKASRIPELLGSLDDTASTALGIVVEEYMKQLVVRSTREPLVPSTKRSVQAFASTVLHEFNYTAYLEQCKLPALTQLSVEQTKQVADDLAQLVLDEFVALVSPAIGQETLDRDQLIGCIADLVHSEIVSVKNQLIATETVSKLDITSLQKLKALKLAQHTSKVTGQRLYKYEISADVGENHSATVALDGFESREAAERSIERMRRALDHQDKRRVAIEHPPPKAEDPIITELYEQLLDQVRRSRSTHAGKSTSTSPNANAPNISGTEPSTNDQQ